MGYYYHLHPCLSSPANMIAEYLYAVAIAAFNQQNAEAFYLSEQDVSIRKFDPDGPRSTEPSLLNTRAKNLLAVIRSVNRCGHRPILHPHDAIICQEEVRPAPVMNS